jgi:hypothetical protein
MYSPKIREDLIPRVYQRAQEAGVPMTRWVNRLIEQALHGEEDYAERKEASNGRDAATGDRQPHRGGQQP